MASFDKVFQEEPSCKSVLSNKRKHELIEIEDGAETNTSPNPNCSSNKKAIVLPSDDCPKISLEKGKAPMDAESPEPHGSALGKEIEGKGSGNDEAKRRPRSREDAVREDRLVPKECPWCKVVFANRFAVSGHSRSCYSRYQQTKTIEPRVVPSATAGRNFDLNRLPLEAFSFPEIIARLRPCTCAFKCE